MQKNQRIIGGNIMEFIDSIWFTVLLGVAGWVLIYIKTEQ
jgi:hypothetical protein